MSFVLRDLVSLDLLRRTRRFVLAGTVTSYEIFLPSAALAEVCRADGLNYAGDCVHSDAGTVVTGPVAPNVDIGQAPDLGETGFSISIEGIGGSSDAAPTTIAGVTAGPDRLRQMDRLLELAGVDLTYDGLGGRPRLAIATQDLREGFVAGETVTFRASSNYPGWIAAAEVVITDLRGRSIARVPIAANGTGMWQMPAATNMPEDHGEYLYFLRVSDAEGRRDETKSLALKRLARAEAPDLSGPVIAAGEGNDMTAQRGIPVRGGAITVSGRSGSGQPVTVLGERVPVDRNGSFVIQRILPPGTHAVAISIDGRQLSRSVTVERSEWFGTGIIDLTLGRQEGETWRLGRIAGFAQGILADGTRITASVDTREEELRDLFRNFGRKHPDQVLREIQAEDVFATFGDDSQMTDLAPSSGKFFLRAERDNSHLQWGDFKPRESTGLSVRSDRALYGLSGEYRSPGITGEGESRLRITGFAAQADSLMQRDVMRATGGSAYFLSRQDLLVDSETVFVQVVSRTTGLVVETRVLTEGRDYRINPVQGVIILNAPLSSGMAGDGLIRDNPLGDYDVNLVAQYEYVPTVGDVDGYTAGARSEVWANDQLRFGASVIRETSGLADNTLAGADILWRQGENRELLIEYAVSEGPGFGSSFSLNGGLDLEPTDPSYGLPGLRAGSLRVAGRTDLGFAGMKGEIAGFYDRKEKGFSSPDQDFGYDQQAMGLSGRLAISARTDLTFGGEALKRDDGLREEVARIGLVHRYDAVWLLEWEVAHDRRVAGTAQYDDQGRRIDAALRLTWRRDEALSAWVFGQATVARDGSRQRNDRLGVGAQLQLSEKLDVLGEVSHGSLGGAGRLELNYRPNADTSTTIGYRLDPLRRFDTTDFSGRDRGSLVFGTTSKINNSWSYTSETNYSAFGTRPALTSGYGVSYTPSERWNYDAMFQYGGSRESDGSQLDRRGVSLGLAYKGGETVAARLRGEWRQEESDRPENELDRDTWLLSGAYEYALSPDWRFLSSVDAVFSESDQSSFRDGRYVEARLGYAWRPANDDRVNALLSYSYLYDLPGADQVNIDGDINGARQKSHILNAAINWQLNPSWTLGAKYGYRLRESAERGSDNFVTSEAHLLVLRADYHIVHNWDVMMEVRNFYAPRSDTTEQAALLGVYRLFGDNLRVGGGYLWGEVDDDLRKVEAPNKGFFLNITTQF
ncbi:transporter [Pseudogemmobacter faecipullorum]|uniref:Transporter n=1 Tax=Pseudogemmobacter faecipullorum TaxID=2755041 RepID=A0ABS8CR49_9RHOB|nr:transporter [Pseudogemmobacter faecipullorum]MCB5411305.1 transporter [Pseudogemmobacter faecipullorum]